METACRPRLLDQVRERCRVKHSSLRTEQAYVHWIRRFIVFHDKPHSRQMGGPEVEAFLSHLARFRRALCLDPEPGAGRNLFSVPGSPRDAVALARWGDACKKAASTSGRCSPAMKCTGSLRVWMVCTGCSRV